MSDYDQQLADQVQMQFELDETFKDLEEGNFLTERQIDLLRHCCGYVAPKPNQVLKAVFDDFGTIFGANK
jgi:hypothetical protein